MQDPLFPELPEDLSALSDDDLATTLQEHRSAAELIDSNDEDFLKGLEGDEVLSEYERGVQQIESISAEQDSRVAAQAEYDAKRAELSSRALSKDTEIEVEVEVEEEDPDGEDEEDEEKPADDSTENDEDEEKDAKKDVAADKVLVAAAVDLPAPKTPRIIRPAAPKPDRLPEGEHAMLVAAAGLEGARGGEALDRKKYAKLVSTTAMRRGKPSKSIHGNEERVLIASAQFPFPEERILGPNSEENSEKIRAVIPQGVPGLLGLTASGGLCAPLEPIYTMPNFASEARPVRDALPSFQASRGGVNVPAATYIGDITTAITTITEENDALGGTFATKSCQDLDCPAYTQTAVTIISHCRTYGNLNAMAWPEKIAHENDLTMAAHARTAEGYLLDRIKAQSVNVTNGVETLGALIYLVEAIVRAKFGISSRLRMDRGARFRALLPAVLPDLLVLDTVQTIDGNRFQSTEQLVSYLRSVGIEPTFYLDTPSTGTTQIADAAQTAAAIDSLPDNIQWAIFPEGAFIHVDSGSLELGLVRDSTLNSTNDFQMFGESFENVALLAPAQAAYWVTSDICASGQFPPAGTVRTCD